MSNPKSRPKSGPKAPRLRDEDVPAIRRRRYAGETLAALAREFGVAQMTIQAARREEAKRALRAELVDIARDYLRGGMSMRAVAAKRNLTDHSVVQDALRRLGLKTRTGKGCCRPRNSPPAGV